MIKAAGKYRADREKYKEKNRILEAALWRKRDQNLELQVRANQLEDQLQFDRAILRLLASGRPMRPETVAAFLDYVKHDFGISRELRARLSGRVLHDLEAVDTENEAEAG